MLDRVKQAARDKLQRAVAEVVEAELTAREGHFDERLTEQQKEMRELHAETMKALGRLADGLAAEGDRLHHRIDDLEDRARRDIWYLRDVNAAAEAAEFVAEHLPTADVFWHGHDTLRFALTQVKGPGSALEFGVATGTTLKIIADAVADDRTVVGFDTFTGLPETWRTGFSVGKFAQERVPEVAGAEVIAGLFEDELPGFLARGDEPIAFMHIDCDLYSSTKTILALTEDRLAQDAVLLFDEFFNFPGWQQHEFRAWTEFLERTGRTFEYLAYTGNSEQVVVRLH
jgi:predicted O-methyltransferase YrrM